MGGGGGVQNSHVQPLPSVGVTGVSLAQLALPALSTTEKRALGQCLPVPGLTIFHCG